MKLPPRNFIFRVREFEQMELEFFVEPGTDLEWHETWVQARLDWWYAQGLSPDNLECLRQKPEELAHYSKATVDILYRFPHGLEELEGIADRTDYDLGSHSKNPEELGLSAKVSPNTDSTDRLIMRDATGGKGVVPFVIEPSAGVDRGVLAILTEAYQKETLENDSERIVLKLKPHLAPIKVAVIPLAKNNPQIVETALRIKKDLQKLGLGRILLENSGNVGKNYRRHDEIGTPICITVDFESIEATPSSVTVRNRDTTKQERVELDKLVDFVRDFYQN